MKQIATLQLLVCCLLLTACGSTSYKVAPSTTKVATKVATAKRTAEEGEKKAVSLSTKTKTTQTHASNTTSRVDQALSAIERKDYIDAALQLIAAKVSNAIVEEMLRQALEDVESMRSSFKTVSTDLSEAGERIKELDDKIIKLAEAQAKAQAIVDQVNWGFGLGAIIYGVKRILTFGFWGAIILGGVALILAGIGWWVGVPILSIIWKFISSLFRKKPPP